MTTAPEWVRVARVLRPHGVSGEVAIELLGGDRERLRPGMALHGPSGDVTLEAVRGEGSRLICRLRGVEGRDQAAAISGGYLEVARSASRPLADGEFFHFQLVGLEVQDPEGRRRGELVDVEAYPAHDVYVVRTPASELRVPAVREAVLSIDLDQHKITVAEPYLEEWVDAV
ncbi:MAG: ribosome maturation factor RimM [Candidatus Dormiibacterota bacterium]